MPESARTPEHPDAADRLREARRNVVATLDDAHAPAPRAVRSPTPIKALPDDIGAVVVARVEAGLSPSGPEFPRRPVVKRVALPSAALAILDLVLLIVALVADNTTLAAVSGVLLVVFGAAATFATRYAAADPLRIGPSQQRAIDAAGRWAPSRAWSDPGPQRALVGTATDAAQRIVESPAWRHGVLARGGVVLSLAAELDLTESQAATATDTDWARLVTRVCALVAYADTVTTLAADEHTAAPDPDDTEALAFFLSAAIYEVA